MSKRLHIPINIFHGLRDEVVPLAAVQTLAKQIFVNHTFTILEDDHSLHNTFTALDWDTLLL
jgi:predicted esterase